MPSLSDINIDFGGCTSLLSLDFSGAKILFANEKFDLAFDYSNYDDAYNENLSGCSALTAISLPHTGIRAIGCTQDERCVFEDTSLFD